MIKCQFVTFFIRKRVIKYSKTTKLVPPKITNPINISLEGSKFIPSIPLRLEEVYGSDKATEPEKMQIGNMAKAVEIQTLKVSLFFFCTVDADFLILYPK
jgi:hypothetical protein